MVKDEAISTHVFGTGWVETTNQYSNWKVATVFFVARQVDDLQQVLYEANFSVELVELGRGWTKLPLVFPTS